MKNLYLDGEERFGPATSLLYDLVRRMRGLHGIHTFVASDLAKSKVKAMLDVGCGPMPVALLAWHSKGPEIYCVDPSVDMVRLAKKNSKGNSKVRVALGSSRHVPFAGKFGLIYSSLSFHHWQDKSGSLRYLKSRLGKSGEIRIYDYIKSDSWIRRALGIESHAVNMKELDDAAEKAGLRITGIVNDGKLARISLKA
jgi:SAM-dependent methyltransferase